MVDQGDYEVVSVENGGSIRGTVKWQGALPHLMASEIKQRPTGLRPLGQKHRDLERLLVVPGRWRG